MKTDRYKLYGEVGIQEQFHFAESWKVVEEVDLLGLVTTDQKTMFKNRMMGIIFATDMSRHMADIKEINQLLAIDVNSEGGLKSLITSEDQ